jgi:putative autotransporter adhesin-like protein
VDGNVDQFLAEVTGAGDVRAKDLHSKTVEISTTGAADAYVTASDTLRISITGAGDVTYYGNPKTIEKHVTGAGSIRHKE